MVIKYIIGGCALGIILGSLPIGLGAAFALYFWRNGKWNMSQEYLKDSTNIIQ